MSLSFLSRAPEEKPTRILCEVPHRSSSSFLRQNESQNGSFTTRRRISVQGSRLKQRIFFRRQQALISISLCPSLISLRALLTDVKSKRRTLPQSLASGAVKQWLIFSTK